MRRYCGVVLCTMLSWSTLVRAEPVAPPGGQPPAKRPLHRHSVVKIATGSVFVALGLVATIGLGTMAARYHYWYVKDGSKDDEYLDSMWWPWGVSAFNVGAPLFTIGVPLLAIGIDEQKQDRAAPKGYGFRF